MPIERVVIGDAKVIVRAPLPRVFEALVNPEDLRRWWAPDVRVEPELGGRYESTPAETPQEGTITAIEAPRKLTFTWQIEHAGAMIETAVSYELSPRGSETQVHVVHASPRTVSADWFEFWRVKLDALKSLLETGAAAISSVKGLFRSHRARDGRAKEARLSPSGREHTVGRVARPPEGWFPMVALPGPESVAIGEV